MLPLSIHFSYSEAQTVPWPDDPSPPPDMADEYSRLRALIGMPVEQVDQRLWLMGHSPSWRFGETPGQVESVWVQGSRTGDGRDVAHIFYLRFQRGTLRDVAHAGHAVKDDPEMSFGLRDRLPDNPFGTLKVGRGDEAARRLVPMSDEFTRSVEDILKRETPGWTDNDAYAPTEREPQKRCQDELRKQWHPRNSAP